MSNGSSTPSRYYAVPVFGLTVALLVLLFPARLYGDDVFLVSSIIFEQPFGPHFLFMPIARAFCAALAEQGLDPFFSLRLLSALGSALGVALLFAAARRRHFPGRLALPFALAPLAAPSGLFFATAAGVHGLHLGAVGFLAWTLACIDRRASPWRALVVGLAFGAVVGTHRSGALLIFGCFGYYMLATGGRALGARFLDAQGVVCAGVVSVAALLLCNRFELGQWISTSDSLEWFRSGIADRFEQGYGWSDALAYMTEDFFAPAWVLSMSGMAALGVLCRRRLGPLMAALAVLLPYVLFFPLFGYSERGAYFVVLLPLLAGLTMAILSPRSAGRVEGGRLWALVFTAVLVGGLARPEELLRNLSLPLCALVFLVAGLVFHRNRRPHAIPFLALLVLISFLGAQRSLRHFDRRQPLLDWASSVCTEIGGAPAVTLVGGFQQRWMLDLLHRPWPAPYAGTWALAEGLPTPGPYPLGGYPALPLPELLGTLEARILADESIYIDDSMNAYLEALPGHRRQLEALRERFRSERFESGSFRGERIKTKP